MGTYTVTLQKGKTLNLKRFDGTIATIAQTKYLCRLGQLHSTQYNSKGEEVLAYPQFQNAINRIEDNLEDFKADYIIIGNGLAKKTDIEKYYLNKPTEPIRAAYNDDFPTGVEKESYIAIKLKKGFVIVPMSNVLDFCRETPELWNQEFYAAYIRVNDNYTASVRTLNCFEDYLTGYGKDQPNESIWFDSRINQAERPIWQKHCMELLMVEARKNVKIPA